MKYKSMGGLTVKDGRLINDRQDGLSGIAEANNLRNRKERADKVSMLADGILLAEAKKKMFLLIDEKEGGSVLSFFMTCF